MALRKLAGPFNILDSEGNPPTELGYPVCYVPYMGVAMLVIAAQWQPTGIIALDGLVQSFTDLFENNGVFGWDAVNRVVLWVDSQDEWIREPRSFLGLRAGAAPAGLLGRPHAKLADRRLLYGDFHDIIALAGGVETTEYDGFGLANAPALFSAGRKDSEVFVGSTFNDGTYVAGRFYDFVARHPSSDVVYVPYDAGLDYALLYAAELSLLVMVAWGSGRAEISLWSLEVLPASVSDAALYSGHTQAGNIGVYRCQVLGDAGEPCAGELVDWALTAGDGELLDQQSKVDQQGYASARVLYHLGDTGDTTLQASVRC